VGAPPQPHFPYHAFVEKHGGTKIMLLVCRRTVTEFKSFYNRKKSIFASFTAGNILTSFRTAGSKRADPKLQDLALYLISSQTSTMDPNSIITQVSRDQDQLNTYQASSPTTNNGKFYILNVNYCYNG